MAEQVNRAAFTEHFIRHAHSPSVIDTTYAVRNMDIAPLSENFDTRGVTTIATLMTHGHVLEMGVKYDLVQIRAHVALDLMQIAVNEDSVLNMEESRAHLVSTTRALCLDIVENEGACRFVNLELADVDAEIAAAWVEPTDANRNAQMQQNIHWASADDNEMTANQAMTIMLWLVDYVTPLVPSPLMVLALTVAALTKKGTVTDEWISRYLDGINADTGKRVAGTRFRETSSRIWTQMSNRITPAIAAQVCGLWTQMLPVTSVRLRTAVQHASKQGMTTMLAIGRAMRLFPRFEWARLLANFPAEGIAWNAAVGVVNGDVYFGYSANLGAVRSRLFPNLAWTAKELLIRFNGETGLANYAGWIRQPKKRDMINELLAHYAVLDAAGDDIPNPVLPEWYNDRVNDALFNE